MTGQTINIDAGESEILNLDADDQGHFIAFTDNNTVITNYHSLTIDTDVSFPIIRKLNDDTFLIASARRKRNSLNGFIYNFNGGLLKSFDAGDGIQDIIIHREKIIITYFDEGVYGGRRPNGDGLAVFNFQGEQEFGVNSSAGYMVIADCYCICKYGANKVLFYAYTDFNMFELNLDTYKMEQYDTPNDFRGASAISSRSDIIILHSSYDDEESFFSWDRNKKEVIKFGEYPRSLKGIGNGKFLAYDEKGYTIINPIK